MRNKGTVLLALLLIGLGGYLLVRELGLGVPEWGVIWPVLPLAGGIALLVGHFLDQNGDPDQVFLGTAALLVGGVFLFVTLSPLTYGDLEAWWPIFVLIAGIAFLAQWAAAGFTRWDALFLGLVSLGVGGVSLAIMLQLLGPNTRELFPRLWPALLILAGLVVFLRGVFGRRAP